MCARSAIDPSWLCSCRYMSQNKHAEARELMCSGALLFFSHGQVSGPGAPRGGAGGRAPGLAPVAWAEGCLLDTELSL